MSINSENVISYHRFTSYISILKYPSDPGYGEIIRHNDRGQCRCIFGDLVCARPKSHVEREQGEYRNITIIGRYHYEKHEDMVISEYIK